MFTEIASADTQRARSSHPVAKSTEDGKSAPPNLPYKPGSTSRANSEKWRKNMHDTPFEPMSVDNVEEFDVWIFDSEDLVVSVIPHHAPLNATTEDYEIRQH